MSRRSGDPISALLGAGLSILKILLSGGRSRPTLRSQNRCSACGYTWFPRGKGVSLSCPGCGSRNVGAPRSSGIAGKLVLGFLVVVALAICATPKPGPTIPIVQASTAAAPAMKSVPAPAAAHRKRRIAYVNGGWISLSLDARRAKAPTLQWEEVDAIPTLELLPEELARWTELSAESQKTDPMIRGGALQEEEE